MDVLEIHTTAGRVERFPEMQMVVDEFGALWVGDEDAVEADRKGRPALFDAWFAPSTVDYTKIVEDPDPR